jgi:hypothetical protein
VTEAVRPAVGDHRFKNIIEYGMSRHYSIAISSIMTDIHGYDPVLMSFLGAITEFPYSERTKV